jgi:hypothetical protein
LLGLILVAVTSACGGGFNTPSGPVVGSPGGGDPPPLHLVDVHLSVTLPVQKGKIRPNYLSPKTASLVIQLVSVDGTGVTGVNAQTINTVTKARRCKGAGASLVCSATISGSPGHDIFTVTTYGLVDASGPVLSVGTVAGTIGSGGGAVGISNRLSLSLDGVIAALKLSILPNAGKRGERLTAKLSLTAYDAAGAQIVGPGEFYEPISLTIEGDVQEAFRLHDGLASGTELTIRKPPSGLTMSYDGDAQAAPVTLQASVGGPSSVQTSAGFALHGKVPPPPVGTIYALNLGSNDGQSATVTEYDGKAKGNVAPLRTLALSSKLYARSIAIDSNGSIYVGYFDNEFGFQPTNGLPDKGNEIAIYAPDASGNDQPEAIIAADKPTKTELFPLFMAFDSTGRLVTYGATTVDGNGGNDAVLTYSAASKGATAPQHGWDFNTPQISYAGPTGLALDAKDDFYVNGALHTTLGPNYGLYVAAASDIGNPNADPARTIPWDSTTKLQQGLTTGVALASSGEILIGNSVTQGSGSSTSCQGGVNVYSSGAGGGVTDQPPLRSLTLEGVFTSNSECVSTRYPLSAFFPSIAIYGPSLFVADDFNNAIAAFPADGRGAVKASLQITGSATQLHAPIALAITSSGRAKPRPAYPFHALHAQ